MIRSNLVSISKYTNGTLIGKNKFIDNISINSKNIKDNCLFVAFKGKIFDAHIFINEAIKNGAIAILVSKFIELKNNNISQIIVDDVNNSLYLIALNIRNNSNAYFIAITGSCGKTTTKEMLINILNKENYISYTIDNMNNIIGVILTILNIKKEDKFVVVELGTNSIGQIYKSVYLVKPHIILITNLFISHFLNLKNYEYLSKEKGDIMKCMSSFSRVFINYDSNNWRYWKFLTFIKYPLYFSLKNIKLVDFYASNIKIYPLYSKFILNTPIGKKNVKLNLPGLHNIYNAIASSAIAISLGFNLKYICNNLSKFNSINQRLYPIHINKNKIILNDTYNANIGSFISSINVLSNMHGYKVLVIGNMYELGNSEIFLHKKMNFFIKNLNINKILSIGKLSYFITLNNNIGEHFYNKEDLIKKLIYLLTNNNKISILIKGSRDNNLNEIVETLLLKIKNDKINI